MSIADAFIQEIEQESIATRKHLERVPEADWTWKPHEKSYSMQQLASHIAETLSWLPPTLAEDEFIMDMETYTPFSAANREELLAAFDKNLADALEALKNYPDKKMFVTWTMKDGKGNVLFQVPRVACIRAFMLSHTIHHRAQLGVYLRLRDVPLPSTYGPSADEEK